MNNERRDALQFSSRRSDLWMSKGGSVDTDACEYGSSPMTNTMIRIQNAPSPAQQLKGFIEKFTPEHQRLIRAVRKRLRKRFPTARGLVYDNYNLSLKLRDRRS